MQTSRSENAEPGNLYTLAVGIGRLDECGPERLSEGETSGVQHAHGNDDHRGPDRVAPILPILDSPRKAKMPDIDLIVLLQNGFNSALAEMHKRDKRIERLKTAIRLITSQTGP